MKADALRGQLDALVLATLRGGPAHGYAVIEELKRRMIEDALRECGSKTRAAERLGLTRQSLQQMLRRRSDL